MQTSTGKARWRLASTSVLCVAVAGGFIALFSGLIGGPHPSAAEPGGQGRISLNRAASNRNQVASTPSSPGKPLGELVGNAYRVQLTSSPTGPLYTIRTLDGSILLENATLEEAAEAYPDLDLLHIKGGPDDATTVGPLMLAEPEK